MNSANIISVKNIVKRAADLFARPAIYYAVLFFLSSLMILKFVRIAHFNLHVPASYSGDALAFLQFVKGFKETGSFYLNPCLGLPIGYQLYDFPFPNFGVFAISLISLVTTGKGNYNRFWGSLTIGLNGVVGYSRYPLHFISLLGFTISFFSFLLGSIYLVLKIFHVEILWGNPTLVILMSFLSGIQLCSIGIMSEYIGRIYDEVKDRPKYIVEDAHGF